MSSQSISSASDSDRRFLQPPPGRRYVRSFLFSRRIDAPLGQVHLIVRIMLVLCLSAAQLRTINTQHPDVLAASLFWLLALGIFISSGISRKIARGYMLLMLPALILLFLSWTLLTPLPGFQLFQRTVYDGTFALGLAFWQVLWLVVFVLYWLWRRSVFSAFGIATVSALVFALLIPLPSLPFVQFTFGSPIVLLITDQTLWLSLTKIVGYSGMVFATVALIVASRDTELIGVLRQFRMPQAIIFFASTVCRALNLALTDFETIYQAQIARAVNAQPRNLMRRLQDLASMAIPMVAIMIRRSSEIGDALQARGYHFGKNNIDYYETAPLRLWDWIIMLFALALLAFALFPHPTLTELIGW